LGTNGTGFLQVIYASYKPTIKTMKWTQETDPHPGKITHEPHPFHTPEERGTAQLFTICWISDASNQSKNNASSTRHHVLIFPPA